MDKPRESPYFGLPQGDWADRTRRLIEEYPLEINDLVDAVLTSWNTIFDSSIGDFQIGEEISLSPQALGGLLHELLPLVLEAWFPGVWRRDRSASEKDLVFIPDDFYSTEIKTSSSASQIFGNRSFAQESKGEWKKTKSGYYIAVNFDKPSTPVDEIMDRPAIRMIRLGWIDHIDWSGQLEASGQQANLAPVVEDLQLLTIYENRSP